MRREHQVFGHSRLATLRDAAVAAGALGGKGILDAGNNLGVLTGLNVHFGTRVWKSWLQPQFKLEGYFVTKKDIKS